MLLWDRRCQSPELHITLERDVQKALKGGLAHTANPAFDATLAAYVSAASTSSVLYVPWPESGPNDCIGYGLTQDQLTDLIEDVDSGVERLGAVVQREWAVTLPGGVPSVLIAGRFGWNSARAQAIVMGGHDAGKLTMIIPSKTKPSPHRHVAIETKQGAITALLSCPLFPHSEDDIVTGDALGECRVLSAGRLVGKCSVGAAVTCLEGVTDLLGNRYVIAGDAAGVVTAFDTMRTRWKLRVGGLSFCPTPMLSPGSPSISCVIQVTFPRPNGTQYTLVADGASAIHVYAAGTRIRTIGLPYPVTTMASGSFRKGSGIQVLAAGIDGDIYIIDDTFKAARYIPIWSTVTLIKPVPVPSISAPENGGADGSEQLYLVAGQFCQLRVYSGQKLVHTHTTEEWIQDMNYVPSAPTSGPHTRADSTHHLALCLGNGQIEMLTLRIPDLPSNGIGTLMEI
ncbi:hypothetical protein DFJ77DRAFT_10511 [Powellomyces hirtus]|nr:hypothetical protein DFJ77DRAFT_10511 [Powellomyces hirtus]